MSKSREKRGRWEFLPTQKVVAVVATRDAVDEVQAALRRAGFAEEDIYVHHGEQGEENLDLDGSRHGLINRWIRAYQHIESLEKEMIESAERGLASGHYLVGVQTDGGEPQRAAAHDAVSPHASSAIYYCGKATVSLLSAAPE